MATTTEDLQTTTPVVTLTPEAHKIVQDAIAQEPDPASLALWLEVRGVQEGSFVYDLYFQAVSDAGEGDARDQQDELVVVVPEASVDRLRGARLEWSEDGGGGLVLVNPNTPTVEEANPGVPPEILAKGISGPLATRVMAVLEQAVNPSIASHGGRADVRAPVRRVSGLRHVADDAASGDRDDLARRGARADQGDRRHRPRQRR